MSLSKVRSLYVVAEGSFGVDPDAAGSSYLSVPASEIGDIDDGSKPVMTNALLLDNLPSRSVAGADGGSFSFGFDLQGMAAAAGNGVAPGANDFFDVILTHVFGSSSQVALTGRSITSSTASGVTMTSAMTGLVSGMIIPAFETAIPASGPRTQWALMTGGTTTTPVVAPNWTSNPTSSGVVYGTKQYRYVVASGPSLAFAYRDGSDTHTLLGCAVTSISISSEINAPTKVSVSVAYDSRVTNTGKGSLVAAAIPANSAIIGLASPVWFGGTLYPSKKVEINFGLTSQHDGDVGAVNGRSGYARISMEPTVAIEPLRSAAVQELQRANTAGTLVVQLGRGVLASSKLNTCAFGANQAETSAVAWSDDSGRSRQSVSFRCVRPASGSFATFARA